MAPPRKPKTKPPVEADGWTALRRFTGARIALGRAGTSQPTRAQLDFQVAHALARDAVHAEVDLERLSAQLSRYDREILIVRSAAADRATYLQRPDLGRRLDAPSRARLEAAATALDQPPDIAFVVGDGLSATAVQRHAAPLLDLVLPCAARAGWRLGPLVLAEQARVAIADEVGEILGATVAVILIGERPGLSSPDSLGVYLTYAPKIGRTDAERNCISNIRPGGLGFPAAARTLCYLLTESLRRRISGVALKDEAAETIPDDATARGNFLGSDGTS